MRQPTIRADPIKRTIDPTMPLSWNEIKSRALTFSRTWADAANEDSQDKPFWIDFFEIFGITDNRQARCHV